MPRLGTLQDLARGLGLPLETVRRAAAEATYGHPDEGNQRQLVRVLVNYAERLDDTDLEVLLAAARAMVNRTDTPV